MTIGELTGALLFQNEHFLVAYKPAGLKAQDDSTPEPSLLTLFEEKCKHKLFLVHRLDRPVSGLMIFAKSSNSAARLSKAIQVRDSVFKKEYLAVVKNAPNEESAPLRHLLVHDRKSRKSRVVKGNHAKAKEAKLRYRTIGAIDRYTLLEIELETGRFHQIRCQLAAIGSPIKGDVKYGARRRNRDRSIHLHAFKLHIPSLEGQQAVYLQCGVPEDPVWNAFKEQAPEIGVTKYELWKEERT